LYIYIQPLTGKPEQQWFTMRIGVLTRNDIGGAAQVAAGHCPNKRTLDPAVCSVVFLAQHFLSTSSNTSDLIKLWCVTRFLH